MFHIWLPARRLPGCAGSPATLHRIHNFSGSYTALVSALPAFLRRLHAAANAALPESSGSSEQPPSVSLAVPTFMVWGADTGVGKTLVSAGLAAAAARSLVSTRACSGLSADACAVSPAIWPPWRLLADWVVRCVLEFCLTLDSNE